ncbi:unnamed protein product [Arctia plantaginis]|uniref:Uncharacterized protein n=1 Tax=Arctia plantaginis TaxID=874455 RepID=A0A8S1B7D7_ARCPL|nr:unnamed protein product [Arctia plantaginis]
MVHQKILTYTILIVCFKSTYVYSGLSEKEYLEIWNLEVTRNAFDKCMEKFDVSSSEGEKMYTDPDYEFDPLFLDCFFTECGIMDKGIFNVEKSMSLSKLYVQREDELARLYNIRQECSKVNEAKVSDGEAGYGERARLLYDCLKEKEDDFVLVEEQYRKS